MGEDLPEEGEGSRKLPGWSSGQLLGTSSLLCLMLRPKVGVGVVDGLGLKQE